MVKLSLWYLWLLIFRTGIDDPDSEFMTKGRRIFNLSKLQLLKLLFASSFPKTANKLHIKFFAKEVGDFFLKVFLDTLSYRKQNDVARNDFVNMMLKHQDQLKPSEMAAESTIVFAAGYETSSTLTQFALYELALNPDIQRRLRDEITAGIEENDGKLTYDMLIGFKYLNMVTSEALRKYPSVPQFSRKSATDYKIPGSNLVIPQGATIDVSVYSLHHDPAYFPAPEKFDPERFSDENVKSIVPFTYLPFGEGPRQCLGMRFGLMQSKMAIAKLVSSYAFSPCERTPIPMKFASSAPFMAPEGGMWLRVENI
jgi:cytochrome P450 family 6